VSILIEGCAVLDPAAPWGRQTGRHVLIEGTRIAGVSAQRPPGTFDRVIDGRNFLAIPGLVNAHTHSLENYARATDERLPLEPWLVHTIWALDVFSERDYYLAAMVGVVEMLLSGTTAVIDHLGLTPGAGAGHLGAAMEAYRDSGIRAGIAPLIRQSGFDTEEGQARGHRTAETVLNRMAGRRTDAEYIELLEGFFRTWHNAEGGRLRCWTGPSGVQWATVGFLHQCLDVARRAGGGLHMHLMESRVQDHVIRRKYGRTAVALLAGEKLLGPDVSLPHSVWITDRDVRRIADAGAVPVHNPAANLRLGSGHAPIRKMLAAGITPGLGADGAKSSDHQNMFGHLHIAALIHNLTYTAPDSWIATREAVRMATEGGAAALMLAGRLGRIEPGYLADITLLDLRSPSLTPFNDAYHHLAFTELGRSVHSVIIDGRLVVEAGRILTFDSAAILEEVREATKERMHRRPFPREWQEALDRYMAFQQDIVRNTAFSATAEPPGC
jgi:cytosine/adenosine deaminase-related metal-dependent hydrolase